MPVLQQEEEEEEDDYYWQPEKLAKLSILDSFETSVYESSWVTLKDGTFAFTYKVPDDATGGEYQAKVESDWESFPTTMRKFRIK